MEAKGITSLKKLKCHLSSLVRKQDSFGIPISLTKNGSETHQTTLGGFISILASVGLLCYFIMLIQDIYKNNVATVTQSTQYINGFTDNSPILINLSNFDFAVRFYNYNESYLEDDYELYVHHSFSIYTMAFNNETQQFDVEYQQLPVQRCGEGRFLNNTEIEQYKQFDQYLCAENLNISLIGNFEVGNIENIYIQLFKCSQQELDILYPNENKTCKTDEEITSFLSLAEYELVLNQQYFDEKEFEKSPIKSTLTSYWSVPSLKAQSSKVIGLSSNSVTCRDSTLSNSLSINNYQYFSTQLVQQFSFNEDSKLYSDSFLSFYISKSSTYLEIERTRETIWDILSEIGGLIDIVFLIAGLCIKNFQVFCYKVSLFKVLYLVELSAETFKSVKQKNNAVQIIPESTFEMSSQNQRSKTFVQTLLRRIPLKFNLKDFIVFSFCCFKRNQKHKKDVFSKAEGKLEVELDIVKILKQLQKQRILMKIILKNYQRKLLKLNLQKVIKSTCNEDQFKPSKTYSFRKFLGAQILERYLTKLLENSHKLPLDRKLLRMMFEKELEQKQKPESSQNFEISENFQSNEHWFVEDITEKDIMGSKEIKH